MVCKVFTYKYCETLKKTANQAVKGMVVSSSMTTDKCTTFSEFKISTSDISKNPHVRATRKIELVHSEVWGPFAESLHVNKYAISFIDEFSRYATVYFMAPKGDSLAKLQFSLNTVVHHVS